VILAPVVVEAPTATRRAVVVEGAPSLRRSGILGALADAEILDDGLDGELSDTVQRLARQRQATREATLEERSLAHAGTAESVDIQRAVAPRVPSAAHIPDHPVRPPSLPRPAARRCLAGPNADALDVDHGYLASEGLSADQIRTSMRGFVQHTMQCIPKGTRGTFSYQAEITVGCDGRVSDVRTTREGGLPTRVRQCIAQTLGFAAFPAHALPDGVTFEYPIQYRY